MAVTGQLYIASNTQVSIGSTRKLHLLLQAELQVGLETIRISQDELVQQRMNCGDDIKRVSTLFYLGIKISPFMGAQAWNSM
eukprot:c24296_g2_i1 orf=513-758(+)